MPEITATWVTVAPSAKGFGQQLQAQVKAEVAKTRAGLNKTIGDAVGGAFKVGGTVALAAAGAVVAGFGKMVKAGVKFNASMQGYEAAFQVLTGSAEGAARVLQGIENLKLESGLDKRVLAQASQGLLSVGVDAASVEKRLFQMAKAGMDNADTFGALAVAMKEVESVGGLTNQRIQQLQRYGFDPLAEIAHVTGRSMESLKAEFRGTEGNARAFTKALELSTAEGGRFHNALTIMADTVPGAMNRTENAMQILQSRLAEGLMPSIAALHRDALTPMLKELGEMAHGSEGLGRAWEAFGGLAIQYAVRLKEAVLPLAESFFAWLDGVNFTPITDGIRGLENHLGPIVALATTLFSKFASQIPYVGKLFPKVTGPIGVTLGLMVQMWQNSETLRTAVTDGLFPAMMRVFEAVQPVIGVVTGLVSDLASTFGDTLGRIISTVVVPILDRLTTQVLGPLMPLLGQAAGLVGDLAARFGDRLTDALTKLMPTLLGLADRVFPAMLVAVERLIPFLSRLADNALSSLFDIVFRLMPHVERLISVVGSMVAPLLESERAVQFLAGAFIAIKTTIGIVKTVKSA
jgi:hypothetical protein